MRYKCLITDHDDTLLDSTVEIHYPCMVECLDVLRPGTPLSFDEFAHYNFDLGFHAYATDVLHLTPEEKQKQAAIWHEWVQTHHASFFPHVKHVLTRFKEAGGILVVSSHNEEQHILADFKEAGCPAPDAIYGWDLDIEKRKPAVYTIEQIEQQFGIAREEMVMLDDMKIGYNMCSAAGVDFIFADWARKPDTLRREMRQLATYTAENFLEVENILFG
ncbi:MAG: HAD family hydrolase [Ruminococcaceae bacterium]|nr:HAD family hydrolase [Oscillospiraceae bacterium]